ncbi:WD40 repeat-like protein [Dacryopinax primogenitus]|uniref:WD40 repeat-like protein n=1 Tax=Dacryopinax primogenitus (strain DJM 731) TaxID=1858805 RepID=M5FV24_DACPD|nr:WD40 repeat-like protein [Dacryopinax primogenitus]EJT99429.1 WD40 repeat-like protein [Dacryopinax primogenitus]
MRWMKVGHRMNEGKCWKSSRTEGRNFLDTSVSCSYRESRRISTLFSAQRPVSTWNECQRSKMIRIFSQICSHTFGTFYAKGTILQSLRRCQRISAKIWREELLVCFTAMRYERLLKRPDKGLDYLYRAVLEDAFEPRTPALPNPNDSEEDAADHLEFFRALMGMVLTSFKPLPIGSITTLIELAQPSAPAAWREMLQSLSSLLSGVNVPGEPIRPLHISFSEFLQDRKRGGKFFIGTTGHHERLAVACLKLLKTRLHFNMGDIKTSYLSNMAMRSTNRFENKVPEELEYACVYWCYHLSRSTKEVEGDWPEMNKLVHHLFMEKILFWVDAASVANVTRDLSPGLTAVMTRLPEDMRPIAREARQFLLRFGRLIAESSAHIYISALPWTPRSSKLADLYQYRYPQIARLACPESTSWPALRHVIPNPGGYVSYLAFTPDDALILCVSTEGTIYVWNAATGHAEREPLRGASRWPTWINSSHDSTRVVSKSDHGTLRVWDLRTGVIISDIPIQPSAYATSQAIFSTTSHVMYASAEHMIKLWEATTGKFMWQSLTEHMHMVDLVAFSHDAAHIILHCQGTVVVWNAKTGETIGSREWGFVTSLAISNNGLHAVAGYFDGGVGIWHLENDEGSGLREARTTSSMKTRAGHIEQLASVAFLADETQIISASEDNTIVMWDAASGEKMGHSLCCRPGLGSAIRLWHDGGRTLIPSTMIILTLWNAETGKAMRKVLIDYLPISTSVPFALSCDATRVAAACDDGSIRVWDVATGEMVYACRTADLQEYWRIILSPDGSRMVTFSHDTRIRLWNVRNGELIVQPFSEEMVATVVFSDDSSRIVTGSAYGTIRVWDASTGEAIAEAMTGHTGLVGSVAFSRHGGWIASGSYDCTIRMWDASTGQGIGRPFVGHTDDVTCVAFSLDNSRIISGCDDGTVRMWDVSTGRAIGDPLTGHTERVDSVMFSRDGTRVISCSKEGRVKTWLAEGGDPTGIMVSIPGDIMSGIGVTSTGICAVATCSPSSVVVWDSETGEDVGQPFTGHTHRVRSARFSKDGKQVISVSKDEVVRIWGTECGDEIGAPFIAPAGPAVVGFWHDNGGTIVASAETSIKVWDASTEAPTSKVVCSLNHRVTQIVLSGDGTRIAAICRYGTVMVWAVKTGKAICLPLIDHGDDKLVLTFSHNGSRIVSKYWTGKVRLWNADTGESIGEPQYYPQFGSVAFSGDSNSIVFASEKAVKLLNADTCEILGDPLIRHADYVTTFAFSQDSTCIASATNNEIRVWNVDPNDGISQTLNHHMSGVTCVAFLPDDKRIVSGHYDSTIMMWDAKTGQPIGRPLTGHTKCVTSVAVSRDVTHLVTGSWDKTVRIWDVATGEAMGEPFTGHTSRATCAAISPNGKRIAYGSEDKTVIVWDVESGQPIGEPHRHTDEVLCVAFSAAGTHITSVTCDWKLWLWDVDTGQTVEKPLNGRTESRIPFTFAALSDDCTRLVSVSEKDTARLWDAETGQSIKYLLTGQASNIYRVAFSPDCKRVVSGSRENTVRLWDAETGQPIGTPLTGHTGWVSSVAFSGDGKRIVSGSWDGTVRVWSAETGAAIGQHAFTRTSGGEQELYATPPRSHGITSSALESLAPWHGPSEAGHGGGQLWRTVVRSQSSNAGVVHTNQFATLDACAAGDEITRSELKMAKEDEEAAADEEGRTQNEENDEENEDEEQEQHEEEQEEQEQEQEELNLDVVTFSKNNLSLSPHDEQQMTQPYVPTTEGNDGIEV